MLKYTYSFKSSKKYNGNIRLLVSGWEAKAKHFDRLVNSLGYNNTYNYSVAIDRLENGDYAGYLLSLRQFDIKGQLGLELFTDLVMASHGNDIYYSATKIAKDRGVALP